MGELIPMDPRELATLRARMESDAADSAAKQRGAMPRLKIAGKEFSIEGIKQPDEMEIVLLHAAFNNVFYKGRYNPMDPQPPDCSAMGWDPETLAPSPDLETRVSDACGTPGQPGCCPNNEWNSAATGRGKACKNDMRVAFIAASDLKADKKPVAILADLPPTSGANLSRYIKNVTTLAKRSDGSGKGLPYFCVMTRMFFDERQTYSTVKFEAIAYT